ncbi:ATP-binding domain-containing protein [Brevibacterium sp. HMSC22B09]|uniref:HelD family protein n=1 Tax=Brevibacterium sp. HMSC22B09 TaxID=1581055 RepID=UPI0008D02C4F|nr:ATP-binding domain-containing protein [Brevibacterium sp. HMSC22B09]OFT99369.1 DNA helicase [Brevibacterium sp. HMSC22B09]
MPENSEIQREQTYVSRVYERLDSLREETHSKLSAVRASKVGGNHQNRSERDAFATMYEDQLLRLREAETGLCFGRLDMADDKTTYIGRIGISDSDQTQLLMDWRAPASEPFYRATAANPTGVIRRRHIATRGRTVIGLEDDVLDLDALTAAERDDLHGEGALMAALESHRTGRMGDIVATIQAEQDEIIRRPADQTVVVQGGPGTGKTAVALHRAAYLLYRQRTKIAGSGVLIVGPTPVFLKYIEQVLPSLGETGAVLLTPGQLLPGYEASLHDGPKTAAVKGSLRMVDVIKRAVRGYQRVPDGDQELAVGAQRVTLKRKAVRKAIKNAQRSGKPHNAAREGFVQQILDELVEQLLQNSPLAGMDDPRGHHMADLRMSTDVRRAINLCWLPVSAGRVLSDLYTKPAKLVAACDGLLSYEEMARLRRGKDEPITVEDIPLLDELEELLGSAEVRPRANAETEYAQAVNDMMGTSDFVSAEVLAQRFSDGGDHRPLAERAAEDREWTYGHLVVDEAQELSPMQLRLLFRRVPSKSATIVGDLAQASLTDAARTWESVLSPHVGSRLSLTELTVSYRTPASILEPANALLRTHFPNLEVPTPVRDGDTAPAVARLSSDEVPPAAAVWAAGQLRELGGGRAAVIGTSPQLREAAQALEEAGVEYGIGTSGIDFPIALLQPHQAKGLEFDAVALVEPADFAPAGDSTAVGDLYVALTRATARLGVFESRDSLVTAWL